MTSPLKPARRVLLDKSTNAVLTPSKPRSIDDKNAVTSRGDDEPKCPPVVAGRKRSVDQIDPEPNSTTFSASNPSSPKRHLKDFYIFDEASMSRMEAVRKATGITLPGTPNKPKPQQKHSNNSSTPPRSTKASQHACSIFTSDIGSADTDAGSTHINLPDDDNNKNNNHNNNHNHNHNHNHNGTSHSPSASLSASKQQSEKPSTVPTDPVAYKAFIDEKATLLRSRIQRAMKRLDEKKEMERRVSGFEFPHGQPIALSDMLGQRLKCDTDNDTNVEEPSAVDSTSSKDGKVSKLLPAPLIRPKGGPPATAMLSSTAAPVTNENGETMVDGERSGTPAQQKDDDSRLEVPSSPMELGSPPKGRDGENAKEQIIIIEHDLVCSVERTTSNVTRGEAVDGLLKLMKTTSDYDGMDI